MDIDYFNTSLVKRKSTLIPGLEPYWCKYTDDEYQSKMRPLRIGVQIEGVLTGYHSIQIDSLLSRLVVDEAMDGDRLDNSGTPYLLPIPLKLVWQQPVTELPLWAANALEPSAGSKSISVWWHKRFIKENFVSHETKYKKSDIAPNKGRFKEKRVPLPAQTAKSWMADCTGDPNEIARLLQKCVSIGKKRLAMVVEWTVSEVDEFEFSRPLPVEYLQTDLDIEKTIYCGWTPPYWASIPEVQAICM